MPSKVRSRTTKRAPGPQTRSDRFGRLDGRTLAARAIKGVTEELTRDIGGDPSAGEAILIQNAACMSARLALLQDKLLTGDPGQGDQHHVLAWMNSLTRTLVALGLKRRAKDIPGNPLADHFAKPPRLSSPQPFKVAAE